MAVISKQLFDEGLREVGCNVILHPWNESCYKCLLPIIVGSALGSAKLFGVFYAAKLVMKGKKMVKKEEWLNTGEALLRSMTLGVTVPTSGLFASCMLRKLLGSTYTYYTYLFVPSMLGGLFVFVESPKRRRLLVHLFFNLLIEYWLNILERAGYLCITKTRQTLLFMLGSSLLFYLMRLEGEKKVKTPLFWLFTPEKVKRRIEDSDNACPHDGSCQKYIAKGATTYFGVSMGISLARVILPQLRTPVRLISSICGKHLKLALFLGSYIGIYRVVVCYLCHKRGFDSALYALPAGYLAGLSMLFSPSLGLSIASLTGALKLYLTILYEKKILPSNVPYLTEIVYCILQGILVNACALHPETCPTYFRKLMMTFTYGKFRLLSRCLSETLNNGVVMMPRLNELS